MQGQRQVSSPQSPSPLPPIPFFPTDDHRLLFQPDFMAYLKNIDKGSFLVVQWLGLQAFTARVWVQSLVGELRSHEPCWGRNKKEYRQGAVKEKESPTLPSHLRGSFPIHFFPQPPCVPRTKRHRENCQHYGPKQNHPSSKGNRKWALHKNCAGDAGG